MTKTITAKEEAVKIFKEAEGKTLFLFIDTNIGIATTSIIEDMNIHNLTDEYVWVSDQKYSANQIATLPLDSIDYIEVVEEDAYEVDSEYPEYIIHYYDGTRIHIATA